MDEIQHSYILSAVTFLPLATGLLLVAGALVAQLLVAPGLPKQVWRVTALVSTGLTFLLSLLLLARRRGSMFGQYQQFPQSVPQWLQLQGWQVALKTHQILHLAGLVLVVVALPRLSLVEQAQEEQQ